MKNVYYRVVSGEPLDFCRQFRVDRTAAREIGFAWAEGRGAYAVMEAWGRVWGVIFADDCPVGAGWKAERKKASSGATVYTPSKKTAAGRELRAEMDTLPREPSPNSFAERFNIPQQISYTQAGGSYGFSSLNSIFPYTSFIAWTDPGDSFWVVLPDIDAEIAEMVSEGRTCDPSSWIVPEGLERSTRAHYDLALAQSVVDEQEAKA